jgi:hypothetical protein
MDTFIIIRNYRQQRQGGEEGMGLTASAPRGFLRELDPNALVGRQPAARQARSFCEEDKENFNSLFGMDLGEELMKKLPKPNQSQLINYSDYDLCL